jgi:hypothetical protein
MPLERKKRRRGDYQGPGCENCQYLARKGMLAVLHEGLLVGRTVRRVMSALKATPLQITNCQKRRGNCVSELDWFMSGELGEVTCRCLV